jgi:hypothetical protein
LRQDAKWIETDPDAVKRKTRRASREIRAEKEAVKKMEKDALKKEEEAATNAYAAEVRRKKNKGKDPLVPKVS